MYPRVIEHSNGQWAKLTIQYTRFSPWGFPLPCLIAGGLKPKKILAKSWQQFVIKVAVQSSVNISETSGFLSQVFRFSSSRKYQKVLV